jgi:ribosomal protein S27AE
VREARLRVPETVQIGDEVALPAARENAGERLALEQLQVVGRRCAESGSIIAFEPDARVCGRCERVYHKDHVPEACECGGAMSASKSSDVSGEAESREPAADAASHEATA